MSHTFSRRKESFCLAHQFGSRFGRNSRHFSISFLTALLICSIQASIASAAITFRRAHSAEQEQPDEYHHHPEYTVGNRRWRSDAGLCR